MTEAEWLACEEPGAMLSLLRDRVSDRKMRLFGCACYRSLWAKVRVAEIRWDVLRANEAYADGAISKQAFKLARKRLPDWDGPHVSGQAWEVAGMSSRQCLGETSLPGRPVTRERPEELPVQVAILRCIFGNPFRTVTFSPSWRTDTAVSLARQMYDAREFSAMPILADALQDAGCDNDDILAHCRDTQLPHVRGCWGVDAVLGKE